MQVQPILQQPTPRRSHAVFLKDFVDPVEPHPAPPDSVYTVVSQWLESLEGREKHSRSDTRSDDPTSRELTEPSPEMAQTRDTDGFILPPIPASPGSTPVGPTRSSPSRSPSRCLVETQAYRSNNLLLNNIFLRFPNEDLPDNVAALVDQMRRERGSPGPSAEEVRNDEALFRLEMDNPGESKVEAYFRSHFSPVLDGAGSILLDERQPISRYCVPAAPCPLKVSTPVPDMLYGYADCPAFSRQQRAQLATMSSEMNGSANIHNLRYPFLVVELKGDGPNGAGSLWVATNQCLGASATCVNITERLNDQLRQVSDPSVQPVDSVSFSVATNGTEARLYVTWKENEQDYYMQRVSSFALQRPEHHVEFRRYIRNIIDWAKGRRLQAIQKSLDILFEGARRSASAAATARQPPFSGAMASSRSSKRPKQ